MKFLLNWEVSFLHSKLFLSTQNYFLLFKAASCANTGAGRNFAGSSSHILRHMFLKFSNIKYQISLNFKYLPYLNDCRSLLFQLMMFHGIFPNHPFIPIIQKFVVLKNRSFNVFVKLVLIIFVLTQIFVFY